MQGRVRPAERAISMAVSQIEKEFGRGAIMKLGDMGLTEKVPVIPSGSLALDVALGIGENNHFRQALPKVRTTWLYMPAVSSRQKPWLLL